ncbi:MAG: periplasmic heavy metal sensor [Pseudomonadota bacterium]
MTINRRRVMNWVLVISLGFNLLVVGGITARIMSHSDFRPIPPSLSWIYDDLDEATRAKLRPMLREFGEISLPLRGEMFRAQRKLSDLMTEEPMDKEAIAIAFDDLRKASLVFQETTHAQTIAVFELLNPEQRTMALRFLRDRSNPFDNDRDDDRDGVNREPAGH